MIMADETYAIDFLKLPFEVCLTRSTSVKFNDEEVKECERYLEATPLFPPSMQQKVEDLNDGIKDERSGKVSFETDLLHSILITCIK